VYCDDSRVVDENERDGDEDENDVEDYNWICEIRGKACLIEFRRPRIGVITRRIGTVSYHIGDGQFVGTNHLLKS